jgi:hypothetical protein
LRKHKCKKELSLCLINHKAGTCQKKWRYSSTYSWLQQWMEVTGQFRALAVLPHNPSDKGLCKPQKALLTTTSRTRLDCSDTGITNLNATWIVNIFPTSYLHTFICLDLYVSSRNFYCIYRLQLHRFNFIKILLAQIQRIRWNS